MVDWSLVTTVFLDMDGTLLDLHFDNYFWLEHLPERFAERNQISLSEARQDLLSRYRKVEGTMEWYCLDYWTRELGMDVPLLKEEVEHLIAVHPHVPEFLERVRASGRFVVLVTNAHGRSLELKMRRTSLSGLLDRLVSAHDLGVPKEQVRFWDHLQKVIPFDPNGTLLVDDSLPVLESAERYGIRNLVAVLQPDSRLPRRKIEGFPAITSFRDIMPPS